MQNLNGQQPDTLLVKEPEWNITSTQEVEKRVDMQNMHFT